MRLSGTVMEIRRLKGNGVTTLTFRGHVTSSVTWPFDSRWLTSCRWSTATMHLSGTVTEIWHLKAHVHKQTDGHTCTHSARTHTDEQIDQSHNLLQCSLCSHLADITNSE